MCGLGKLSSCQNEECRIDRVDYTLNGRHYSFLALICYSLNSLRSLILKTFAIEKCQVHNILLVLMMCYFFEESCIMPEYYFNEFTRIEKIKTKMNVAGT